MSELLSSGLANCQRCPRLTQLACEVRASYPKYHAAPVGAWGDAAARLLIVGLAPGLHGAARTGKAFVGDASGEFLFAALHRVGFANSADPNQAVLKGARITNVVKCLPPKNSPNASEINNCRDYLKTELEQLVPYRARKPRVMITLGGVAHRALCRALGVQAPVFGHGNTHQLTPKLQLISSFHPSRLNVNTGRITAEMLDEVLLNARAHLDVQRS